MPKPLIILGAGGNAYDLLDTVEAINAPTSQWSVLGFLDDSRPTGSTYLDYAVLGRLSDAHTFRDAWFASSIWNEVIHTRLKAVLSEFKLPAGRLATLVHPAASISPRAELGHGVVVHYGASIAGAVVVSDHVSIGPRVVIGHQSAIHSYTCVAAGAVVSGRVRIEDHCYIGSGSLIKQGLTVGAMSLVGLGAVVVSDVSRGSTVVGNPAKPLNSRR